MMNNASSISNAMKNQLNHVLSNYALRDKQAQQVDVQPNQTVVCGCRMLCSGTRLVANFHGLWKIQRQSFDFQNLLANSLSSLHIPHLAAGKLRLFYLKI
ncbi:hypothetical protein V6N13_133085 [Hibiscus sabdariffa]|uniref:Uncharacterized protein n=1 Tax=Hibiscus sabdariffa TaxID=183260 RepID=A0ABR2PX61_9ROSI